MTTGHVAESAIRERTVQLLSERAAEASICPSEVARALRADGEWRALMPRVRDVASSLARDGIVTITQGDAVLDPDTPLQGAIRLRRGPRFASRG